MAFQKFHKTSFYGVKRMITLTYEMLLDNRFSQAFGKLSNYPKYQSTRVAYNIAKIAKQLNEEINLLAKLHLNLVKEYAQLDEKGDLVPVDGRPGTFQIREEVKETWFAKIKEFNETEIKISRDPITLEDIIGVPVSPMEILILEPLMKGYEGLKSVAKVIDLPTSSKKEETPSQA